MHKKYWEKNSHLSSKEPSIPKGAISPYDNFFRKNAPAIGWGWRMIAAIAHSESRFKPDLVSWAGAVGIMQLMPITARKMGLEDQNFLNPELNIEAGVKYIKLLDKYFQTITNEEERVKFILASYNSGPAHIFDAIELTKKYGKDPNVWFDNVEYFLIKKNDPEFYQDPVVKYGSFRGTETVSFVKKTLTTYESFLKKK